MKSTHYIACDLGAESGRVMLGTLHEGKLEMEEIHRFLNLPVRIDNSLRWDILGMFREMKTGLSKIAARGIDTESLSVDSWGVDYIWMGAGQPMLAPSFVYRDERVDSAYEQATAQVSKEKIFEETGLQFMPFNTLYQLFSDHQNSPALTQIAERFLFVADYYNYLFSGIAKVEESMASTTQIYNPRSRSWSRPLIDAFGFRPEVFGEIVPSGSLLGPLSEEIAKETGLRCRSVVATCSHDTGAAVASVPAENNDNWAFLSSGTWSLIGVELPSPLINEKVRAANFTNEGGFGGTTRFLKNIVGLWILQECKRSWEKAGNPVSYDEITAAATSATPLRSLINPDDPRFLKPGQMPEKIAAYCKETNQPIPEGVGPIARCILESLALLYRFNLDLLEEITGRKFTTLHIVGGGSKSLLLNRFAANATGRTVFAGPSEATAIGNLLIQAIASGQLSSLSNLRETVRNSFPIETFLPEDAETWANAAARLAAFREKTQ